MFCCCCQFLNCGSVWSVDAWQKKRKFNADNAGKNIKYSPPISFVWTRRLVQILIGVIYFGAALTKMHTAAFFTGDQMIHWSLTELNHHNALGEFIALKIPMVLVFAAYTTIVWEVLFLFLAWGRGWGRLIMISVGIIFHFSNMLNARIIFLPSSLLHPLLLIFRRKRYTKYITSVTFLEKG